MFSRDTPFLAQKLFGPAPEREPAHAAGAGGLWRPFVIDCPLPRARLLDGPHDCVGGALTSWWSFSPLGENMGAFGARGAPN